MFMLHSLLGQWLRMCYQCGTHVPFLGKIPPAVEQLSLCAIATDPVPWSPAAATAQARGPRSLRSTTRDAPTASSLRIATKSGPSRRNQRKPSKR